MMQANDREKDECRSEHEKTEEYCRIIDKSLSELAKYAGERHIHAFFLDGCVHVFNCGQKKKIDYWGQK